MYQYKNWRAKTTQLIKNLASEYAYVLTGTPLENKLDELYSIVQFLDRRLLGPAWQFMAEHVIRDEWGAIVGYRGLDKVKRKIAPIFLRRRKDQVLHDLPERIDSTYYLKLESAQRRLYVPREAELRSMFNVPREDWTPEMMGRLLQLITEMREICDAAELVGDGVWGSSKMAELPAIVEDWVVDGGHKAIVFTQWERVTRLVEGALGGLSVGRVRLHGGLRLKERQRIIDRFHQDPDCRVFISTDAGGLGLNLQAADVVINVDLPWNPASWNNALGGPIASARKMLSTSSTWWWRTPSRSGCWRSSTRSSNSSRPCSTPTLTKSTWQPAAGWRRCVNWCDSWWRLHQCNRY